MAAATVFAISASCSSSSLSFSPKSRNLKPSAFSSSSLNRFPCKPISARPSFPRDLYRVRATILQDEEEKVVVEESFEFKATTSDEVKGSSVEGSESEPSSDFEKWVIKAEQSINIFLTDTVIKILDTLYHDRDYARFFVLETIARVPYFAFMSVLHMYESFGWWRRRDYLKVHFAESWNEMHHLLIMEELGGNAWWFDRFLA